MHTLHDRPAHPSGGEIPHQQMGVAGGEGFYHSTPSGLFVPNVQHIPQQSPWQQTGGKSRSQAIPIVPPKVRLCGGWGVGSKCIHLLSFFTVLEKPCKSADIVDRIVMSYKYMYWYRFLRLYFCKAIKTCKIA